MRSTSACVDGFGSAAYAQRQRGTSELDAHVNRRRGMQAWRTKAKLGNCLQAEKRLQDFIFDKYLWLAGRPNEVVSYWLTTSLSGGSARQINSPLGVHAPSWGVRKLSAPLAESSCDSCAYQSTGSCK